MNAVVMVVALVACLNGGTMADDPVPVVYAGSNSSTGSTGSLFGCKPQSTSSLSGPRVKFQTVRTSGVEYTRVLVPSGRMMFGDVVKTDLGSLIFTACANAATEKKLDAFSFISDQCMGYKIGDGICPCTTGDFVLYRAATAIRSTSSARGTIVGAPLPAGYIRKIIYPSVSLTGGDFESSSSSCEVVAADTSIIPPPLILHTVNGQCYFSQLLYISYPCDSCAGPATEVIVKKDFGSPTHLLSSCGGKMTVPVYTFSEWEISNTLVSRIIYSHEGYGCIPYPNPASDDNCDITVLAPNANEIELLSAEVYVDIDDSAGSSCDGDEFYVYFGPADGSPCRKKSELFVGISEYANNMTIRFQRKPAYNPNNINKGFLMVAYGYV